MSILQGAHCHGSRPALEEVGSRPPPAIKHISNVLLSLCAYRKGNYAGVMLHKLLAARRELGTRLQGGRSVSFGVLK